MKRARIAVAVLALAAVQGWSATITWDYARTMLGGDDMLDLPVVEALNVGSGTGTTVDGVAFKGDGTTTSVFVPVSSGGSYSAFLTSETTPSISDAYHTLLSNGKYSADAVVLSNLTVGAEYTIQIWTSDARANLIGRTVLVGTERKELFSNAFMIAGGLGQYIIGTFTADSATQTIPLEAGAGSITGKKPDVQISAAALYSGAATFAAPPTFEPGIVPAEVTWDGYVRPISDGTDTLGLTAQGTLNVGGAVDVTLDGIAFAADDGAAAVASLGGTAHEGYVPGPQGSTDPDVSQDYIDLLDSGRDVPGGILITGLTNGQSYTVQLWVNDASYEGNFDQTEVDGGARLLRSSMQGAVNSLGQYLIGTFTANSAQQVVSIASKNGAKLNAVAVYDGAASFDPDPPAEFPKPPPPEFEFVGPEWISGVDSDFYGNIVVTAHSLGDKYTTNVVGGITFLPDDNVAKGGKYSLFIETNSWPEVSDPYKAVLTTARYNVSSFNLKNLTVGQQYSVQLFSSDARATLGAGKDRTTDIVTNTTVAVSIRQSDDSAARLGQYAVAVFTAKETTKTIVIAGGAPPGEEGSSVINAYILYKGDVRFPPDKFEGWMDGYGLIGADAEKGADPDGDGLNNLYEYGLNGDPTNSANQGTQPACLVDSSGMKYIYVVRTDDPDLQYYLEINNDLATGSWTQSGYTTVSGPSGDPDWELVTNSIPVDLSKKFIRLIIE